MEFDTEILETAVKRKSALAILAGGPLHRQELEEKLDISKATCHRIIRSFDQQNLLRRTENGYELSEIGHIVRGQVDQFETNVRTAHEIEPLLEGIAESDVEYEIELFNDANIARAQPNDPYPPIKRFLKLFRESDTLRNFGPTPIPPAMVDEFFELQFEEQKRIEMIKPYQTMSKYVSEYAEYGRKAAEQDLLGSRVYNDFTFGLSLFDDSLGLRGYDLDTGTVLVFLDTDDPEALVWGEEVFAYYRERSAPLSQFDEFPEWAQEGLDLTIGPPSQ